MKQTTQVDIVQQPILENLNLSMKSGDFLTVVGQVGCGKSSLLMAIMQETVIQKGSLSVKGSIAYVEQEPFIFSGSVRDNITFGLKYDEDRLKKAVEAA